MSDETAWVIEKKSVPLGLAKRGGCHRWVTFTDDDLERFATKADAANRMAELGISTDEAEPREHMWCDPPPPAPRPKDGER